MKLRKNNERKKVPNALAHPNTRLIYSHNEMHLQRQRQRERKKEEAAYSK